MTESAIKKQHDSVYYNKCSVLAAEYRKKKLVHRPPPFPFYLHGVTVIIYQMLRTNQVMRSPVEMQLTRYILVGQTAIGDRYLGSTEINLG